MQIWMHSDVGRRMPRTDESGWRFGSEVLALQAVGETAGNCQDHPSGIGVAAGRQHRAASNVKIGDSVNATVRIDNAGSGVCRHARGTHRMREVYGACVLGAILPHPCGQKGPR